jgi:2-keto-3-deoxy-6-phosphogluconate aldolase
VEEAMVAQVMHLQEMLLQAQLILVVVEEDKAQVLNLVQALVDLV